MLFRVEVRECLVREIEIEAENANEAEDKILEKVQAKEIVLDLDDRTNVVEVECWDNWE